MSDQPICSGSALAVLWMDGAGTANSLEHSVFFPSTIASAYAASSCGSIVESLRAGIAAFTTSISNSMSLPPPPSPTSNSCPVLPAPYARACEGQRSYHLGLSLSVQNWTELGLRVTSKLCRKGAALPPVWRLHPRLPTPTHRQGSPESPRARRLQLQQEESCGEGKSEREPSSPQRTRLLQKQEHQSWERIGMSHPEILTSGRPWDSLLVRSCFAILAATAFLSFAQAL
eukprot:2466856-Rhodomonas_salina.2